MPRLNTLLEVGFCASYMDGDYRVSAAVKDLSRERYDELRLAALSALACADEMWRAEQANKPLPEGLAAATASPVAPIAP